MNIRLPCLCSAVIFLVQCEKSPESPSVESTPNWLAARISQYQSEPVQSPPREIKRFTSTGKTYFSIVSPCCDQFDSLFDIDGHYVCAVSGGISGQGSGNCPDLVPAHNGDNVVWKDDRGTAKTPSPIADAFTGEKYGCSDMRVYRQSEDGMSIAAVFSTRKHLRDSLYTVELGATNEFSVKIFRFTQAINVKQVFCNDVVQNIVPRDTLLAVSGKIRVEIMDYNPGVPSATFRVNLYGGDIVFDDHGERSVLKELRVDSVAAGWLPG